MAAVNPPWQRPGRGTSSSPRLGPTFHSEDRVSPLQQSSATASHRNHTEANNQGIVGLQAAFDAMLWDYLLQLQPVCSINEPTTIPTHSHEQLSTSSPTHVISRTPSPVTCPKHVKPPTSSADTPQTSSAVMYSSQVRPRIQSAIQKNQTSSGCLVALEPVVRTKASSSFSFRSPRDTRTPLRPRTILQATKSQAPQPPFDTTVVLDAETRPKPEQKGSNLREPTPPRRSWRTVGRPPTPPTSNGIGIIRALIFRSIVLDPNGDCYPSEEIVCQDLTSPTTIKQVEAVLSHVPNEGRLAITELRELATRPVSKLATLHGTTLFELRRELTREGLRRQHLSLSSEGFTCNSKRQDETSERRPVLDEAAGSDRPDGPDTVRYGERAAPISPAHVPSEKKVSLQSHTNGNNRLSREAVEIARTSAPPIRHARDSNGRAQRSAHHTSSKMKRNIEICEKYSHVNLMTSLSRTGKILLTCCLAPPIFTFSALLLFQISCECA